MSSPLLFPLFIFKKWKKAYIYLDPFFGLLLSSVFNFSVSVLSWWTCSATSYPVYGLSFAVFSVDLMVLKHWVFMSAIQLKERLPVLMIRDHCIALTYSRWRIVCSECRYCSFVIKCLFEMLYCTLSMATSLLCDLLLFLFLHKQLQFSHFLLSGHLTALRGAMCLFHRWDVTTDSYSSVILNYRFKIKKNHIYYVFYIYIYTSIYL